MWGLVLDGEGEATTTRGSSGRKPSVSAHNERKDRSTPTAGRLRKGGEERGAAQGCGGDDI